MGHVSINPRRVPNTLTGRRGKDQRSLSIAAVVCVYCRYVIRPEEERTRATSPLIGPAHLTCVPVATSPE
jgi:hypothetical protein